MRLEVLVFANKIVCVTGWRVANARHSIKRETGLQGSSGHGDGY